MTTLPTPPPVGYLSAFVEADSLMWQRRLAAGWDFDPEHGWAAPCGTTESDWEDYGWPLPEDEDFADWFEASHYYDALDEGVIPVPYPNAVP